MTDEHFEDDENWISKSEVKRQMHALQALGEALTQLNAQQLKTIPASDLLVEAVNEFNRLKQREAKRRMLQRIGKLMREEDADAIQEAVNLLTPGTEAHLRIEKRLESWRARLIEHGDHALNQFLDEFPHTDRQQLRQLVRNAQNAAKKTEANPQTTSEAKKLFKLLRDVAG
jgi:ribosome-associated protein